MYYGFYNIYVSYAKFFILLMSISLMPLFHEIIKLDEYKSGIASRLFVQPETKTFKTKVQLVNHTKIVISYGQRRMNK